MFRSLPKRQDGPCFRRCCVESLEARRVLTFGISVAPEPPSTAEDWAARIVDVYEQRVTSPATPQSLALFEDREELDESLGDWAEAYWNGLFGEPLTKDLWNRYTWGVRDDWLSPLSGVSPQNLLFSSLQSMVTAADLAVASDGHEESRRDGQEQADLVQWLDATNLIVAQRGEIRILDMSDPAHPQMQSAIDADLGDRLLLQDETLLSIGSNRVRFFDLADRQAPRLIADHVLQGQIVDASLQAGQLRVVTNRWVDLPPPELVSQDALHDGLEDADVEFELGAESSYRFERVDEYLARLGDDLLSEFLPDVVFSTPIDGTSESMDGGTWSDLSSASGTFDRGQTTVWLFDVSSPQPILLDVETLQNASTHLVHAGGDSTFLTQRSGAFLPIEAVEVSTEIYHFESDASGQELFVKAATEVPGAIRQADWLSEHDGHLRVLTEAWTAPSGMRTASLYVMHSEQQLEVVGRLEEFAGDQALLGAFFEGDLLFATTGEVVGVVPLFDPLHVIDIGSPAAPVELGELEIDGIVSQIRRVDQTHLVGIGVIETELGWKRHVTLFDIETLSEPRVAAEWTSDDYVLPDFIGVGLEPLAIEFDSAQQLLVFPERSLVDGVLIEPFSNRLPSTERLGARALRINVGGNATEATIDTIGRVAPGQWVDRILVLPDHLLAFTQSGTWVSTLEAPGIPVAFTEPIVRDDRYRIPLAVKQDLDVLRNDEHSQMLTIVDVTPSRVGASVAISSDGQRIEYEYAAGIAQTDVLIYTVQAINGSRFEGRVNIELQHPERGNNAAVAQTLVAYDVDGNPLEQVDVGDVIWIEFRADVLGDEDQGVFQAMTSLEWDEGTLELVGAPEPLNGYSNGWTEDRKSNGFDVIGGFNGSLKPLGPGPQSVFRFQARVLPSDAGTGTSQRLTITTTPTAGVMRETLIYGHDDPVQLHRIASAKLSLPVLPGTDPPIPDVNQDQLVSAVDALAIVNFLNRRADQMQQSGQPMQLAVQAGGETGASSLDVNRDGLISALDVLTIVNHINQARDAVASSSAEGEEAFRGESLERSVDVLAASYNSSWDLERRRHER